MDRSYSLSQLVDRLAEISGRNILIHPLPVSLAIELSGVRISTDDTDHICYPTVTSCIHQQHIVIRAFTYCALRRKPAGISLDDWEVLMPRVSPLRAPSGLPVQSPSRDEMIEADRRATLIGAHVIGGLYEESPGLDDSFEHLTPLWEFLRPCIPRNLLQEFDSPDARLYRLVIEISEASLRLRPHMYIAGEGFNMLKSRAASLTDQRFDSFMEAALLRIARHKTQNAYAKPTSMTFFEPSFGEGWEAELERLRQVAKFSASCQLQGAVNSIVSSGL